MHYEYKDNVKVTQLPSSHCGCKPKIFKSYQDNDSYYKRLQAKGLYDISLTFSWIDTHR